MVSTLTVVTLSVDPEFRSLLPEPSDDELARLRQSILSPEGCRDPIDYWSNDPEGKNPIVDGMHRHDICTNEGVGYSIRPREFPNRQAVLEWIFEVQTGRRNITEAAKSNLRGLIYGESKGKHGGDRSPHSEIPNGSSCRLPSAGKTRQKIAEELGVSERTIQNDFNFSEVLKKIEAKSKKLKKAAIQETIPRSATIKLANAPDETIEKLDKQADNPKALKASVKELTKRARNNGQPVNRPKWKEIEGLLGKALNRVDELNIQSPHGNLHRQTIAAIKQAMAFLEQWKGSKRA